MGGRSLQDGSPRFQFEPQNLPVLGAPRGPALPALARCPGGSCGAGGVSPQPHFCPHPRSAPDLLGSLGARDPPEWLWKGLRVCVHGARWLCAFGGGRTCPCACWEPLLLGRATASGTLHREAQRGVSAPLTVCSLPVTPHRGPSANPFKGSTPEAPPGPRIHLRRTPSVSVSACLCAVGAAPKSASVWMPSRTGSSVFLSAKAALSSPPRTGSQQAAAPPEPPALRSPSFDRCAPGSGGQCSWPGSR